MSVSRGGVPKTPLPECLVGPLGLQGDVHAHPNVHGGPLKAVLVICMETLDELRAAGFPVYAGALGENLTVQGIDRRQMRAGQRWRAGDAVIELTTLRVPCSSIRGYDLPGRPLRDQLHDAACKAGNPESPVWARGGFYASVVQSGTVRPGAPFVLIEQRA